MGKDRKIDMVILGLLSHENLTGYDIKKGIDNGIRYFWKGSFGSIYPALNAMEASGHVKRLDNTGQKSGRERIVYTITELGREALREWLREVNCTNDMKYETLLKLYFGANVEKDISLRAIERFEREVSNDLQIMNFYKERLEGLLDEADHKYFYLTVIFGIETYEAYLRWCEKAKSVINSME